MLRSCKKDDATRCEGWTSCLAKNGILVGRKRTGCRESKNSKNCLFFKLRISLKNNLLLKHIPFFLSSVLLNPTASHKSDIYSTFSQSKAQREIVAEAKRHGSCMFARERIPCAIFMQPTPLYFHKESLYARNLLSTHARLIHLRP